MAKRELQLWEACSAGDLPLVAQLTAAGSKINVNWLGPEKGDGPLHRACRFGHLEIVKHLLQLPQVDINLWNTGKGTPFFIACQQDQADVVSLLLKDPRVVVNDHLAPKVVVTPFIQACQYASYKTVAILARDERIDVNKVDKDRCTGLLLASYYGQLATVQVLLASEKSVDVRLKTAPGHQTWCNKTPAEVTRLQMTQDRTGFADETVYRRMQANGPAIIEVLEAYEANPIAVRRRLRELPVVRDPFVGQLFALMVLIADNFLSLNPSLKEQEATRFFAIGHTLPIELQMVLCNRVFASPKDIVLTRHSEPAFREFGLREK